MKTKNLIMAALVFTMVSFTGCGQSAKATINQEASPASVDEIAAESSQENISVVTTIFPEYDWVRQVAGDASNVDITMLLDNGVDLHSYQPTAEDIMKIATCDVFIYVGGESDEWVEDALAEAVNNDMQVINLLDTLGDKVREEELVEGMEGEEEEEEGEEGEEEEEGPEYDEHVWLSLENSEILVDAIASALGNVDAANADTYTANAKAYNEKLAALNERYEDTISASSVNTILFGDRFPFRYLVDDYNLDYYAAFVGCSAETEASFETIKFLADKVDELNLNTVFTIENSDQKIAETIIANTNSKDAKILSLDSMQSTTSEDVAAGATYLGIMEDNLKVLEEALK